MEYTLEHRNHQIKDDNHIMITKLTSPCRHNNIKSKYLTTMLQNKFSKNWPNSQFTITIRDFNTLNRKKTKEKLEHILKWTKIKIQDIKMYELQLKHFLEKNR